MVSICIYRVKYLQIDKGQLIKGKLGKDLNTEQGYEAAKRCGLALLSQAKKACNDDLSKIKSLFKSYGLC